MLETVKKRRATAKLFKEFAEMIDVTYFGHVSMEDADEPVKGISFGHERHDSHFMHGNVDDYQVTLLLRDSVIRTKEHKKIPYQWTILQLKLKSSGFPHMFIDGHVKDKTLLEYVQTRFSSLRSAQSVLATINATFTGSFNVYCSGQNSPQLSQFFSDPVMQRMVSFYRGIDVELDGDCLYLYLVDTPTSTDQLQKLLDEGLWLAEVFERVQNQYYTG